MESSTRRRALSANNARSWPRLWRVTILVNACFFVMMGNVFSASIPPLIPVLIADLHIFSTEASQLASWAATCVGLGNLWALPTTAHIGARWTTIIGLSVFAASNVWAACSTTYSSLLGTRILGGLSGGVIEALGPWLVVQLFDEPKYGQAMALYSGSLGLGSALGPLITGYVVVDTSDWHAVFWGFAGASFVNLLCIIFMYPETSPNMIMSKTRPTSPAGSDQDKATSTLTEFHEQSLETTISKRQVWTERSFFLRFQYSDPPPNWLILFLAPFRLFAAPAVVVFCLNFGFSIAGTIISSIMTAIFLAQPPYLFDSGKIGLFQLAPLIGLCIGIPIGGILSDLAFRHSAKRNGEHTPESRLPITIISGVISPTGLLLMGFAVQNRMSWPIIGLAWAMISVGLTSSATILLTYATEVYSHQAIHVGVLANAFKSILAGGLSFGVVEWNAKVGSVKMCGTIAGLFWLTYVMILPLYFYGPALRKWSLRFLGQRHVDY